MSGRFVDFYAVLGVASDASQEEIWKAYDRKTQAPDDGERPLLDAAIAVLGVEAKRMAYDYSGEGGVLHADEPACDPVSFTALLETEEEEIVREASTNRAQAAEPPDSPKTPPKVPFRESLPNEGREMMTLAFEKYLREDEGRPAAPPLFARSTFWAGGAFALILPIAWIVEMHLSAARLSPGTATPLLAFFVAALRANVAWLWATMAAGAFGVWLGVLLLATFAAWVIETVAVAGMIVRRGMMPLRKMILLRIEASLFILALAWWVLRPMATPDKVIWLDAAPPISPLLYFFVPLFLVTLLFNEDEVTDAAVWQIFIFLGHAVFVLLLAWILSEGVTSHDYVSGEFYTFGYASWWFLFFAAYRWREWLARRQRARAK